jgi:superfamily II DNA or RNA helicase
VPPRGTARAALATAPAGPGEAQGQQPPGLRDGLEASGVKGEARALRPYQVQAVDAVVRGLREHGRGQLLMACGTGKTRVAAEVAARLAGPGEVVVVLVPSIALAAQVIGAWPEGCPVEEVLAVCSDRTVGERDGMRACELPVPAYTDPREIARWLKRARGRALIAGTYDSAPRLAEALALAGVTAALTVCDEAHRLAGPGGKVTSRILRPGMLPDRYRLFVTATPRIGAGPQAVSMDDHDLFGPPLYTYSFASAIGDGWLKQYRLVVAAVTSAQVADLLGERGDEVVSEGGVPLRLAAAQAALAMCAREFGLRRALAFTARVDQARQFAQALPATLQMIPAGRRPPGPASAGWVHGGMTIVQRDLALRRLRQPPPGGWAVVANAKCLSEGVDVPEIDSVLFCSPKTSVTDIVQACGRALRRHDDAGTATVIVPALTDDPGEDHAPDGDATPYRHVLRVVSALAAHDESLAAALGAARAARRDGGPAELPSQVIVIAPPGTVRQALDALTLRIIDGPAATWDDGHRHAAAYHAAHGNLDVPHGYAGEDGFPLDRWLSAQRAARNAGHLRQGRIRLLDQLGMIWDLDDHRWRVHYREVAAFREAHGHLRIPYSYRPPSRIALAAWLARQVSRWQDEALPAAHAALLRQAGLTPDPPDARWRREFRELTAAITAHGGQKRLPPGSAQASWLDRESEKYRRGTLGEDKVQLFRQAGIALNRDDLWHLTFEALTRFHAEAGHWKIPAALRTPQGLSLAGWAKYQRRDRDAGTIDPQYEKLLDQAGFPWDPREADWQARYRQAAAFRQVHGHLNLPAATPLGNWLYQQARAADAGTLPAARARLLRTLGAISHA